MNHQYMIHAKLFKTTQTLVNAGQRIGIHIALCRFLTVVRAGPAVHERRTRIKQNDDGKRVMPMSEFHHTVDHGLMTQCMPSNAPNVTTAFLSLLNEARQSSLRRQESSA